MTTIFRLSVFKKKKHIGYIQIRKDKIEHYACLVKDKYAASSLKGDYALARGLNITRKSFPIKTYDIDVLC